MSMSPSDPQPAAHQGSTKSYDPLLTAMAPYDSNIILSTQQPTQKSKASSVRYAAPDGFPFSFTTISITVGPPDSSRTFDIDQRRLTNISLFFATMLAGPWRESRDRTVTLPDDSPELFEIFARFLYSGTISSPREGDIETYSDGSRRDLEWPRLARAWVLGDKLQATPFKDAIADAVCEKIEREGKWPTTLHQIIYPNTTAVARGIRRLCVDIAVCKWETSTAKGTLKDEAWGEVFEDMATRLMTVQKMGMGREVDFGDPGCRYHAHVAEGTRCWREFK